MLSESYPVQLHVSLRAGSSLSAAYVAGNKTCFLGTSMGDMSGPVR